ncbi:MAG: glycoside hydrolase family 2 [Faecalibacterium sp.]|nr:glycoside hydrolase family 2 [Ruminococcus sp.]MCM1392890.1 glycoside hydrolase family 2 [Ruminococcus sp.]MCM1486616.1 glycoside hydrolase family 2 [Faecalibacterium sp.]
MMTLTTRWAKEAMCDKPLQEYPRPQMVRDSWLNLNGMFDYAVTDDKAEWVDDFDGEIRVPFAIESCLSGVCKRITAADRLWYRKKFTLPDAFSGKRTLLHFGAVDWECKVYVNHTLVGSHTGGYCPFTFDITDTLTDGENELVVWVYDPTDEGWQNRGKQASESHGFWYTSTSGIWQTVWLEAVSENYIDSFKVTPDIDAGSVSIKTEIEGSGSLRIKVLDGETIVAEKEISADDVVSIPNAKLWSPEEPNLYDFVLELTVDGAVADSVKGYFAMRKFSVGEHEGYARLFLNNKPYFQKGLLDQGYWSDGGLTPPTDEAMIYDIETMKRLGFNMLRKHIKVEPDRWYYHCDKIGMIVWQDMVSGGKALNVFHAGVLPNVQNVFSPIVRLSKKDNAYKTFNRDKIEWRTQFEDELFEMMDALYNHPSIGCWVPFNEGWGQFDAKRIGDAVKVKDPSRIVDHASGWYDQKGCDLRSIHRYILPVTAPKYDGRPFVLSEYGGYSQIIDGHVWNKSKSFGYQMYKSKESMTKAYRKLHENQVIPAMKKGLSATVYTQVSDVEFEVNGMLTYDRELIKLDEDTVIEINKKLTF